MRPPSRLVRVVRVGFLLLAVGLLVAALRDSGDGALAAVGEIGAAAALGSLAAVLAGLAMSAAVWRALLGTESHVRLMPRAC